MRRPPLPLAAPGPGRPRPWRVRERLSCRMPRGRGVLVAVLACAAVASAQHDDDHGAEVDRRPARARACVRAGGRACVRAGVRVCRRSLLTQRCAPRRPVCGGDVRVGDQAAARGHGLPRALARHQVGQRLAAAVGDGDELDGRPQLAVGGQGSARHTLRAGLAGQKRPGGALHAPEDAAKPPRAPLCVAADPADGGERVRERRRGRPSG